MTHKTRSSDTVLKERKKSIVANNSRYNAVMLNDDYSPFEFVVQVLMYVFNKTEAQGWDIAKSVHQNQRAVIHSYSTREIAEAKVVEANNIAKAEGFPLKCIVEKDT